MAAAEFKEQWSRYSGKESSPYQSHFDDLGRFLEQPTSIEADPSGTDLHQTTVQKTSGQVCDPRAN